MASLELQAERTAQANARIEKTEEGSKAVPPGYGRKSERAAGNALSL